MTPAFRGKEDKTRLGDTSVKIKRSEEAQRGEEAQVRGEEGLERKRIARRNVAYTYGVPLILNTLSCVKSKLIYPRVNPAKRPDSRTKMGMRHAKTMSLVLCGSNFSVLFARPCDEPPGPKAALV